MQLIAFKKNHPFFFNYAIPCLFFVAITIILFGNSLIPPPDKIIQGWDIHFQWFFWKSYLADALKSGRIPFWNPYVLSGTPFATHPLSALFSPFNILFLLLPVNKAISLFLASNIFIAGFSTFLFMRKKLGVIPSLVSGAAYCLSGVFAIRIGAGHIDYIAGMAWIPAVIGSTVLLFETGKRKYFLLLIISLFLQILSGMSFIVFLTMLLILIFLISANIHHFYKKRWKTYTGKTFLIFLTITLTFLLSAFSLLPTLEMTKHSVRQYGLSHAGLNEGSYNLSDLKLFINPSLYGYPSESGGSGYFGPAPNFYDRTYFFGVTPVLLFLFFLGSSLFRLFKSKKADSFFFFITLSTLFFLAMALGPNTPVFEKFTALPVFNLYRIPPRYLISVSFLIATSSGIALTVIRKWYLQLAIFGILVVELISFDRKFIVLTDSPTHFINSELVEFFQKNIGSKRILNLTSLWSPFQVSYPYNIGYLNKIPNTGGYDPFILEDYFRFINLAVNRNPKNTVEENMMVVPLINFESSPSNLLSYKYLLSEGPLSTPENKWQKNLKEIKSAPLYRIYENTNPWEKYFLVSDIKTYPEKSSISYLNGLIDNIDFSKTALIENMKNMPADFNLDCKEGSKKEIKVLSEKEESVELSVNTDCNSMLVSNNVYYPGWTAIINNIETPLYKSNLAFRSVYIPKGKHTVRIYYKPLIFYLGGAISLSSLVAIFIILRFWKKGGD